MSKGWKIGLSIAAGFMLVLMLGGGACVYYFSQLTQQVKQQWKEDQKAAERLSESADEETCLKETLARSRDKSAITAIASNSIFLSTCLKKSKPTLGFCDGVPANNDKEASRAWMKTKCQDSGQNNLTCGSIYGIVIGHCQNRAADPVPAAVPEPTKKEKNK